jgi:hypothetical protein
MCDTLYIDDGRVIGCYQHAMIRKIFVEWCVEYLKIATDLKTTPCGISEIDGFSHRKRTESIDIDTLGERFIEDALRNGKLVSVMVKEKSRNDNNDDDDSEDGSEQDSRTDGGSDQGNGQDPPPRGWGDREEAQPRGWDVSRPRGWGGREEAQPRGREVSPPRGREVSPPRGREVSPPRGWEEAQSRPRTPRRQYESPPRTPYESPPLRTPYDSESEPEPESEPQSRPRTPVDGGDRGSKARKASYDLAREEERRRSSPVEGVKGSTLRNLLTLVVEFVGDEVSTDVRTVEIQKAIKQQRYSHGLDSAISLMKTTGYFIAGREKRYDEWKKLMNDIYTAAVLPENVIPATAARFDMRAPDPNYRPQMSGKDANRRVLNLFLQNYSLGVQNLTGLLAPFGNDDYVADGNLDLQGLYADSDSVETAFYKIVEKYTTRTKKAQLSTRIFCDFLIAAVSRLTPSEQKSKRVVANIEWDVKRSLGFE